MNQSEIQTALELHQRAFAFLIAAQTSGHAASRPFDESTVAAWQQPDSCANWLARHYDELPAAYRPEREGLRAFALFLSSFFATSFSVSKVRRDGEERILIRALPNRRLDGTRKSDRRKTRDETNANLLRRMALQALAEECGVSLTDGQYFHALHDARMAVDLTMVSYTRQLVNRAHYASQGPAVYRLWLDLPEKIRRHLSSEAVWQSRGRLVQYLTLSPTFC